MLTKYIRAAMHRAEYKLLPQDRAYYGEIPDCPGVWAGKPNLEDCRRELEQVLEGWILFRVAKGMDLPLIDG